MDERTFDQQWRQSSLVLKERIRKDILADICTLKTYYCDLSTSATSFWNTAFVRSSST